MKVTRVLHLKSKSFILILIISVINCLVTHAQIVSTNSIVIEPESIDTFRLGDINKDGIADSAFIYTPAIKNVVENGEVQYNLDCINSDCYNSINFSCNLPEIKFQHSVWGSIESVNDINNDGICELIFSPGWFTSCWGNLYIFSYQQNAWYVIAKVSYHRCTETALKDYVTRERKKYYLNGEKFEKGDNVMYKVRIK